MEYRLLKARVQHRREKPTKNAFAYNVFYVSVPIEKKTNPGVRLFSWNRFNVLSVSARDHGRRDGSSLYAWIHESFRKVGVDIREDDLVELITHPRIFGYVFNPISFWVLRNAENLVKAVLCEVNNTFGDDHNYILARSGGATITARDRFRAEKKLFVSPFTPMEGHYIFNLSIEENHFGVTIVYYTGEEVTLSTHMGGKYIPMQNRTILRMFLTHPLMTCMVVGRIHWQAIKLFFKRVPPQLTTRPGKMHGGVTLARLVE